MVSVYKEYEAIVKIIQDKNDNDCQKWSFHWAITPESCYLVRAEWSIRWGNRNLVCGSLLGWLFFSGGMGKFLAGGKD